MHVYVRFYRKTQIHRAVVQGSQVTNPGQECGTCGQPCLSKQHTPQLSQVTQKLRPTYSASEAKLAPAFFQNVYPPWNISRPSSKSM